MGVALWGRVGSGPDPGGSRPRRRRSRARSSRRSIRGAAASHHITAGASLSLSEVNDAASLVREEASDEANSSSDGDRRNAGGAEGHGGRSTRSAGSRGSRSAGTAPRTPAGTPGTYTPDRGEFSSVARTPPGGPWSEESTARSRRPPPRASAKRRPFGFSDAANPPATTRGTAPKRHDLPDGGIPPRRGSRGVQRSSRRRGNGDDVERGKRAAALERPAFDGRIHGSGPRPRGGARRPPVPEWKPARRGRPDAR